MHFVPLAPTAGVIWPQEIYCYEHLTTIRIVLAALALFAAMFVVGIYNKLVGLRNRFKNTCAQVDVQLRRRYDLIPNLGETAKGYRSS